MKNNQEISPRLTIVDALRGLALFGILLVHSIEHFDLYYFPDLGIPILKAIDKGVWDTLFFLFGGKSFALFAMMFGLSFYIQMESRLRKNENFYWRFLWRLCILLLIGVLHGLLFEGDVLRFLALFGVLLLVFYHINTEVLWVISFLFLLNLPRCWQLYQSFTIPGYQLFHTSMDKLYGELWEVQVHGTFWDLVQANAWKGFMANLCFHLESGRYMQIPGLFIWGLLLGRNHFFNAIDQKQKSVFRYFGIAVGLFIVFFGLKLWLPSIGLNAVTTELATALATNYANTSFMVILVSGFVWICIQKWGSFFIWLLSPYGRMSLTNYISMGVCCIPLYYGYGLGMYLYFGATICLGVGLAFFGFQLWFSQKWMQHFYYGPLEWLWRSLTFLSFETPLKRNLGVK